MLTCYIAQQATRGVGGRGMLKKNITLRLHRTTGNLGFGGLQFGSHHSCPQPSRAQSCTGLDRNENETVTSSSCHRPSSHPGRLRKPERALLWPGRTLRLLLDHDPRLSARLLHLPRPSGTRMRWRADDGVWVLLRDLRQLLRLNSFRRIGYRLFGFRNRAF